MFSYENNRFSWSEWGDSNSRHLEPKSSALPTGPHPDIYFFFLRKVVKHVVQFHFLPPMADCLWKFLLVPQRLFAFAGNSALPVLQHPNQAPYQLGHTRICNCPPQNHGTPFILYHRCRIVNNICLTETALFLDVPQYQPKGSFLSCPLKFFFTFFAVYGKT